MHTTRDDALQIYCPTCRVEPGITCLKSKKGRVHIARYKAAQEAINAAHPKVPKSYSSEEFATVTTDASLCHKTGAAGWAGRVIHNGSRYTYSGAFKVHMKQSNCAEIASICNTLHHAVHAKHIPDGCTVLIQADNLRVVNILAGHKKNGRTRATNLSVVEQIALEKINEIVEVAGLILIMRHVKGHVRFTDREAKHHVHEAMDKEARRWMKQAREELSGVDHADTTAV